MEASNNADSRDPAKGQWQWKSNKDPWCKNQADEWTSYSPEHNYFIEKAYYDQQNEVEIGDFVISIKHLIQKKKGTMVSQRPIRRIDWFRNDEADCREERYFDTELPKTMNSSFGSLKDMVNFFQGRNTEIHSFSEQLLAFMKEDNLEKLNQTIAPIIKECIQKESEKVKGVMAKKQAESLLALFEKEFLSFQEFYGQIMKAYTLGTFFYRHFNKYLRDEDWVALDNLLPYFICLCFGFEALQEPQNISNVKIIYRGTAIHKDEFGQYDFKGLAHFSWYSVTSTTTRREIAQNFMRKSAESNIQKLPVIFTIEVPQSGKYNSAYLNIKQLSKFPEENEVILAPGSIFQVKSVVINEKEFSEIKLKLVQDVEELVRQGVVMAGNRQSKVSTPGQVILTSLDRFVIQEHLSNYAGNRLVQSMTFQKCEFNGKAFERLIKVLSTTPSLQRIRFEDCSYQGRSSKIEEGALMNINQIEVCVDCSYKFLVGICQEWSNYWRYLKSLSISRFSKETESNALEDFYSKALMHLTDLTSFTWLSSDGLTDNDIINICSKGFRYFKNLEKLEINFVVSFEFEAFDFPKDFQIPNLRSLVLNYGLNYQNQTERINSLCLKLLPNSLENFELRFGNMTTNDDLSNLCSKGFQRLDRLTSLSLHFDRCEDITEAGILSLCVEGLKYLDELESLTLEFSLCPGITDDSLEILFSKGLKYLDELKYLCLRFEDCLEMTSEGYSEFEKKLKKLPNYSDSWSLHYSNKPSIDSPKKSTLQDTPREVMSEEEFKDQINLPHVYNKNFGKDPKDIDQEGVWTYWRDIDSDSEKESKELIHPEDFEHRRRVLLILEEKKTCEQICERFSGIPSYLEYLSLQINVSSKQPEGSEMMIDRFNCLISNIFNKLSHVKSLDLHLDSKATTDKFFDLLATKGLECFPNLISLRIYLAECDQITDESIRSLVRKGFKHVPKLKLLYLSFSCSKNITQKGCNILMRKGIKQLPHLSDFQVRFDGCYDSHMNQDAFINMDYMKSLGFKVYVNDETENSDDSSRDEDDYEVLELDSINSLKNVSFRIDQ